MKLSLKPLALIVSLLFTTSAFAEEAKHEKQSNVGITIGLAGLNLEISTPLNNYVSVRGEAHIAGELSKTLTLESNSFSMAFTPDTKSILIDFYPFSGAFYLTGGLVSQNIDIELTDTLSTPSFNFNGTSYAAYKLATVTGTAGFSNSTAPYLGLGWSNRNKLSSGFAFSFETGLIGVGKGNVDLSVKCGSILSSSECSLLQSDVAAEETQINSGLNRNLYYPVVKLGISYRF